MKWETKTQQFSDNNGTNATNDDYPNNLDPCSNNKHHHSPSTPNKHSFRILLSSTNAPIGATAGGMATGKTGMIELRTVLGMCVSWPPTSNLPPEEGKAGEAESNSGCVIHRKIKGGGSGSGSIDRKLVSLPDPICTLVEEKLFSKPTMSQSHIEIEEGKRNGEHLVVKCFPSDIEVNALIYCSTSGFAFIDVNFVLQYNLPLHKF